MNSRFTYLYIDNGLKLKEKIRDALFESGVGKVQTTVDVPDKIILTKLKYSKEQVLKNMTSKLPSECKEEDFLFL